MLEIEMSRDIKDFQPKVAGPFTIRQIVCMSISLSYGLPLFFMLSGDIVTRLMITLFAMAPVLLCGWLKVYDEPFERFIKIIIYNKFVKPVNRKYKIKNEFTENEVYYKKITRSKNIKEYM